MQSHAGKKQSIVHFLVSESLSSFVLLRRGGSEKPAEKRRKKKPEKKINLVLSNFQKGPNVCAKMGAAIIEEKKREEREDERGGGGKKKLRGHAKSRHEQYFFGESFEDVAREGP